MELVKKFKKLCFFQAENECLIDMIIKQMSKIARARALGYLEAGWDIS